MSLWRKAIGELLKGTSGNPFECATCPCGASCPTVCTSCSNFSLTVAFSGYCSFADGSFTLNRAGCSWSDAETGGDTIALFCEPTDHHWHLVMVSNGYFDADLGTGACPSAGIFDVPAIGFCAGQTVHLVLT